MGSSSEKYEWSGRSIAVVAALALAAALALDSGDLKLPSGAPAVPVVGTAAATCSDAVGGAKVPIAPFTIERRGDGGWNPHAVPTTITAVVGGERRRLQVLELRPCAGSQAWTAPAGAIELTGSEANGLSGPASVTILVRFAAGANTFVWVNRGGVPVTIIV